jgi:hypothetical protein
MRSNTIAFYGGSRERETSSFEGKLSHPLSVHQRFQPMRLAVEDMDIPPRAPHLDAPGNRPGTLQATFWTFFRT